MKTLTLAPTLAAMDKALRFVEGELGALGCPEAVIRKLCIVTDELFTNIARYSGATAAALGCDARDGTATLVFTDDGAPFDPTALSAPDTTLSASERKIGGLGVFMVRKLATGMRYARRDGRNELTVWIEY